MRMLPCRRRTDMSNINFISAKIYNKVIVVIINKIKIQNEEARISLRILPPAPRPPHPQT